MLGPYLYSDETITLILTLTLSSFLQIRV